ncbi:MAG: transglutaminase-like domain-containing protein [Dysgonamonadaceae bacterium]|jgi:transglutaminase-like putative cysteine protease|nr:transglutaminase-like domain-containing protein [Dysgonamonadaceae bacterium]
MLKIKDLPLSSLILCTILVVSSCKKENHFLKDEMYRKQVQEQFGKRKIEAENRKKALFSVFEKEKLSLEQREALEFLYAYMPLCDLADYDGDFFLNQVNTAFCARDYFSWGKTVPDDIFRHFVLVYRINNEYLDTARTVFFEELKDRVKNLSMYDAALEVNHWCHEKVTYKGTDMRTSAPLALVKTSWGRCGEESTFTTAALRSVGIPARQCYTPRWVHTDDNHAWVEVWVDGQWHYLGACEPESELDLAWFTAPSKRAMMVHTIVFGLYTGPEEKNLETPLYSKINLLENYAAARQVEVQVIDENNQPVEDAKVQFKVYNYAELYPIAENVTGKDGKTSIISGKGDLIIWANKGELFGYQKSDAQNETTIVQLNRKAGFRYEEDFVINVPAEQAIKEVSSEKIAINEDRLAYEDSIRNAYMNTFIKEDEAYSLAKRYNLNPEKVWKYLNLSQGNWQEISNFIIEKKDNPDLFPFLASLAIKDLRDTPAAYLSDHLQNRNIVEIKNGIPDDLIIPYILSPRINWELIKPWRSFVRQQLGTKEQETIGNKVNFIIDFIKNKIKIKNEENYYNCPITPQGVFELKIADRLSRNIFFAASCRSLGIPARIENSTGKTQYFENGQWTDVVFEPDESLTTNLPKAKLTVHNVPDNLIKPGYYTHYTLAYFKDGDFHTLDFENNPLVSKFPYTMELDEGYYRLTTGSRANDGSVFVHTEYFELKRNTTSKISIRLPKTEGKLFVKGIVDMNSIITLNNGSKATLKELSRGKGLVLCFLDIGKEPSKHILQDLPSVQQALDEWNGGILFLTPDDKAGNVFDISTFKKLPQNTNWGVDNRRELLHAATGVLQIDFNDNFPLILYLSRNGGILYSTTGYRIGTGEDVLKIIRKEAISGL